MVELHVLGAVEAVAAGEVVLLGGRKQRALLALMAAHGPVVVSREALIEQLWANRAPATAGNVIQVYVSQLRSALGRDRIRTEASGYRLAFERDAVDAWHFVDLVEEGSRALAAGEAEAASGMLRGALSLWGGTPFSGLDDIDLLRAEADRLNQLRLTALERRLEADLACGGQEQVVVELEALVAAYPLRERFWAQLMRALYATGRQNDALDSFRRARGLLVEELGVEPGPELRELEEAILRQDARLGGGFSTPLPVLPATLASGGPTFVGRDAEIAWLLAALERAEGGESVALVVEGAPGIGKTRMVAEFARLLRSRGVPVTYAAGVDALAMDNGHRGRHIVRLLDEVEQLPAVAAPEFASRVADSPPGCLTVVCYSAALTSLPMRVALARLVAGVAAERVLGPLSSDEVARVARGYDAAAGDVEVTMFANDTGEVSPLEAHEAASAWAVGRASRRVQSAAAELPAPVARATAARENLLASLMEANAAQERRLRNLGHLAGARPYLGLMSYSPRDAPVYFGREHLVAETLSRLVGSRFLLLAGASGTGKSSLVRAGVLPALAAGSLPGSEEWPQLVLTPGSRPDQLLEASMPTTTDDHRVLIVLDQLEEVFTAAVPASRARFGDQLARLLHDDNVTVLATVRTDFLDVCTEWPPVAPWLPEALVLMTPMGRGELRRVIEQPLLVAGVRLEDGLADLILDEAGDQPGVLPLLSTALLTLWERREGAKLTHAAYRESGGVRGAINRLAETTYASLQTEEQDAARRILLRLGDSDQEHNLVRRRLPIRQIAPAQDVIGRQAIGVLAARRLLVVDRDSVEVAHEALLSEWTRLRAWLEEDAQGRRVRQQLTPAAQAWHAAGKPTTDLYRGARLVASQSYANSHRKDLNPVEQEFIEASQRHTERERLRQRRSVRQLRALAAALTLLVAVAALSAVAAVDQRNEARTERIAADASARRADARSMSVQAVQEVQPDRALLLAAQSIQLDDNPDTRAALLTVLTRTEPLAGVVRTGGDPIEEVATASNGRLLAERDLNGRATLVDAATGDRLAELDVGRAWDLDFSPDGSQLAVIASQSPQEHQGRIYLYDVANPEQPAEVIDMGVEIVKPQLGGEFFNPLITFVGDGAHVIVTQPSDTKRPGWAAVSWDLESGQRQARLVRYRLIPPRRMVRLGGGSVHIDAGPDSSLIDPTGSHSRRFPRSFLPQIGVRAVSPSGRLVAESVQNDRVAVRDALTGRRLAAVKTHSGGVTQLVWAPDGKTFATAGDDGTAVVWSARRLDRLFELRGHRGRVNDLAFSPDGQDVYTAGQDGSLYIWNLVGEANLATSQTPPPAPDPGYVLSRTAVLPAAELGGPVWAVFGFWTPKEKAYSIVRHCPDGDPGCPNPVETRIAGEFESASLSSSGDRLLMATYGLPPPTKPAPPISWHLLQKGNTGLIVMTLASPGAIASVLAPGGRMVAATRKDGRVAFWDADTQEPVGSPVQIKAEQWHFASAFNPDGTRVLVHTLSGDVAVVGVDDGLVIKRLLTGSQRGVLDAAFSPDGSRLAIYLSDGSVLMWNTQDWRQVPGPPTTEHTDGESQSWLEFTPDSKGLVTAGSYGVQLWHPATWPVGLRLPIESGASNQAHFLSEDRLVTNTESGDIRTWPLDISTWIDLACARAGRDLSESEWRNAAPGREPQPTCHNDGAATAGQ